jgi:hypothetical protein
MAVGRALRLRGIDPHEADSAAATFGNMTAEQLEALFAKCKTCLCLVGNHVVAKLATPESILASERIDRSTGATSGLLPAALDVQRVWMWLQEEMGKIDQKRPGKRLRPVPDPCSSLRPARFDLLSVRAEQADA